jgi:hypothetical protein
MTTYTDRQQESGGTTASTDAPTIPDSAGLIGLDATGARHYLGNRVTRDGIPVFVEDDDDIKTFDLTETPCTKADDVVEAWIDHVERKRGVWRRVVYNQPLAVTLAQRVEVEG